MFVRFFDYCRCLSMKPLGYHVSRKHNENLCIDQNTTLFTISDINIDYWEILEPIRYIFECMYDNFEQAFLHTGQSKMFVKSMRIKCLIKDGVETE